MALEFKTLWANHPINRATQTPCIAPRDGNYLGTQVRAGFPTFDNQCSIRMGVALKAAGVQPSQISGCVTCGAHASDEMHYVRAQELGNALSRASIDGLGRTEVFSGADASQFYKKVYGRSGIMFFNGYWHRSTDSPGSNTGDHIDVWNGYRSSAKWLLEWFSWLGYYSNYANAKEIKFWEVK